MLSGQSGFATFCPGATECLAAGRQALPKATDLLAPPLIWQLALILRSPFAAKMPYAV